MKEAANRPAQILLAIGLVAGIPALSQGVLDGLHASPTALTVGPLFGAAFLLIIYLILRISPAWPGRPPWWVLFSLLWGDGTAFLFVTLAGSGLSTLTQQLHIPVFSASLAGALPEEIGKSLGVLVVLLACRKLDRPWHVLAVATLVGLGFTIVENMGYAANGGLMDPASDTSGAVRSWLPRSATGLSIHSVYTSVCGWGIALALFTAGKSRTWRVLVALGWFLLGFGLHFAWNAAPESPWSTWRSSPWWP